MTRKLKSETSTQKIDVSADIIFESLTLQSDFVILDLNCFQNHYYEEKKHAIFKANIFPLFQ